MSTLWSSSRATSMRSIASRSSATAPGLLPTLGHREPVTTDADGLRGATGLQGREPAAGGSPLNPGATPGLAGSSRAVPWPLMMSSMSE